MPHFANTIGSDAATVSILLAEDDWAIRQLMSRTLERAGYRVVSCQDGVEALDFARQHQEPIHLLITDVLMPGLDGFDLLEKLHAVHPETPALVLSGYTQDSPAVRRGLSRCGRPFLLKPFTQTQFLDYVVTTLSSAVPHDITDQKRWGVPSGKATETPCGWARAALPTD